MAMHTVLADYTATWNVASDMVFGMQNWLGIGIVVLLFAYHYIIADPKYAEKPVTAN